jgi:hypothetical protein
MDLAKFEASVARFKARTLELKAKRHAIIQIDKAPKPQEAAHSEKARGRVLPPASCRCRAKTMEGKQCGFKAVVGDFCKKHAIKTSM